MYICITMNDKSYNIDASLSDKAISELIGHFIKKTRIEQNRSQSDIAKAAGISRSTLSLLERGDSITLATLIQVLRVLDRLNVFQTFVIEPTYSPIQLAKIQAEERQRAYTSKSKKDDTFDW